MKGTKYRISVDNKPVRLKVKVANPGGRTLGIKVYDESNPKRVFTDRYHTFTGDLDFSVRMPISPKTAIVQVYAKDSKQGEFGLESVDKLPLQRKMDKNDIASTAIRSFVDFAERVSYNLDSMEPGTYRSDDGLFYIKVSEKIVGKNGSEVNTPARIDRHIGEIEISKPALEKMTIPGRFAVLCHEFSHYYLNEKIDDEMEADLNGLLIYLALGYPRIEALQAFTETFKGTPTELNGDRTALIEKFITDFENMNMVIGQ
jgi:hypothetical protein